MEAHHKTKPELYETALSEESSKDRAYLEDKLDALYAEHREAVGMDRLKLQKQIDKIEQNLVWHCANPKQVPFSDLKELVREPTSLNALENKYRARISNRATAIRAYCVWCMGGDISLVRGCTSITCPLYSFRMGKDPLRGWDIPKVDMPEAEDEEDIGLFEEGDEGSEADGD